MKKAIILGILLLLISPVAAVNMGNKYLVDNFTINQTSFNATLENQNNGATGEGYYEISTSPAANHQNILQNGTFNEFQGTTTLTRELIFEPVNGTQYWILVFTDYPEHDNRVSKDSATYIDPGNNENNETDGNNTNNQTNNETNPIDPGTPENPPNPPAGKGTIPMQTTGANLIPLIFGGLLVTVGIVKRLI